MNQNKLGGFGLRLKIKRTDGSIGTAFRGAKGTRARGVPLGVVYPYTLKAALREANRLKQCEIILSVEVVEISLAVTSLFTVKSWSR